MKRKFLLLGMLFLILGAACTPVQVSEVQTLVASLPESNAPISGQVAALPTPNPDAATPTPPTSSITFPTPAPTVVGPLATLTAIANMLPTQDLWATPYTITYQGRPHFIEFQARW